MGRFYEAIGSAISRVMGAIMLLAVAAGTYNSVNVALLPGATNGFGFTIVFAVLGIFLGLQTWRGNSWPLWTLAAFFALGAASGLLLPPSRSVVSDRFATSVQSGALLFLGLALIFGMAAALVGRARR